MELEAILTKQIDATWAAGDDAGGMNDNESVGNATWYHVHLIYNPTTKGVDAGFDTSATAANLLADAAVVAAGYTKYRRLGSVLTDGSANILGFVQVGDEFRWKDPPMDVSVLNPGTSAVTRTLSVPSGVKVMAHMNAGGTPVTDIYFAMYLSSLEVNDEAAIGIGTAPGLTFYVHGTAGTRIMAQASILTNTSSQIRSRAAYVTAGFGINIATTGWTDWRGRND